MGEDLWLLPRPRAVERLGRWVAAPGVVDARVGIATRFAGDEAYRLTVDGDAARGWARIEARTETGARHGRATLAQLVRRFGGRVPAVVIEDAPVFAVRGVMLDVSRDRVPTMECLFETVDLLASLKINHLQVYTEHTFAYRGHEELWAGWSPITPDEARRLDAHCRARGVELAANQNCFGHLSSWLRHPRYAPLAETHGEWVFSNAGQEFPRSGPFSLCPMDPGSLALVEDLLSQLLPCFSSPLVNIGCDETFDVGFGRSRAEVERRGRGAVYAEFVGKIAAAARRHGKRAMFWADIALSDPGSLGLLPGDLIGLAWGYEPDAAFGEWCGTLRRTGHEAWACPGTSSWRSITGRTTERRANIRRAAAEGATAGASGFLVTDWGDTGHHQQWPIALHAIAEGADAAWSGDAADEFDPHVSGLHAFGDARGAIGPWLDRLGDVDVELRRASGRPGPDGAARPLRNASALFTDLHTPLREPAGGDTGRKGLLSTGAAEWEAVAGRIEGLASSMPGVPDARDELLHTLEVARVAARRGLLRRRIGGITAADRRMLAEALQGIVAEHRRLWLARSREGGLDHSCGYYRMIIDDLMDG